MSVSVVFQQMIIIAMLVFMGFLVAKLGMFSPSAGKDLSVLVVHVCNPALILMNVLDEQANVPLEGLAFMAVLSLAAHGLLVILGILIPRIIFAPRNEQIYYNLMTLFGNVGFIGIPVASALLGPSGVVYVVVFNICFVLLIYTYGKFLISKCAGGGKAGFHVKDLINAGSISSVAGIVIYLCNIHLPAVLEEGMGYMGRATTFLSMIVIGISLAQMPFRKTFGDKCVYRFVVVRYLLVPVVLGLLLKNLISDELAFGAILLMLAVPAANLPLMMARENGCDGEVLSRGIVVSTLLSVVTIPLVVFFIS